MKSLVVYPSTKRLHGQAIVPGDKSIGHRALLFSALANAPVRIFGLGSGADNGRTAKAITQLGATVTREGESMVVAPCGLDHLRAAGSIECGNSGTTMRLLAGLLGVQRFETVLTGDESLSGRPMRRVADPINAMGGRVAGESGHGELVAPLRVGGISAAPRAIRHELQVASAQVKSAIVLAALYADGVTEVVEHAPTRDHSERLLAAMGAPITVDGRVTRIDTRGWSRRLQLERIDVPRDPSASAFPLVAALVAGAGHVVCPDVCINPTRTGFLDVVAAMGGCVEPQAARQLGGEPVADLVVNRVPDGQLRGTRLGGDVVVRAIDEIPVLSVLAARAAGDTEICDAEELRVKESDRIATTCEMLQAFGVEVEQRRDGMKIIGRSGAPLRAATVHAHGDHRIAMAAAVAALVADGPTRIDDCANVATSFPHFVEVMTGLGARIEVID